RHLAVQQNQVIRRTRQGCEYLLAVCDDGHLTTATLQHGPCHFLVDEIIFGEQHVSAAPCPRLCPPKHLPPLHSGGLYLVSRGDGLFLQTGSKPEGRAFS